MEKIALALPGGRRIDPIMGMPSGGDETLTSLITNGITLLFILLTLTALLFLIWGGISYITSQGDKNKVEAARKKIIYAIIGLIIGFASFMIISTVSSLFQVKVLDLPESTRRCGGDTFGTCPNPDRPLCRRDADTGRYRCQCNPSRPGCAF